MLDQHEVQMFQTYFCLAWFIVFIVMAREICVFVRESVRVCDRMCSLCNQFSDSSS